MKKSILILILIMFGCNTVEQGEAGGQNYAGTLLDPQTVVNGFSLWAARYNIIITSADNAFDFTEGGLSLHEEQTYFNQHIPDNHYIFNNRHSITMSFINQKNPERFHKFRLSHTAPLDYVLKGDETTGYENLLVDMFPAAAIGTLANLVANGMVISQPAIPFKENLMINEFNLDFESGNFELMSGQTQYYIEILASVNSNKTVDLSVN